MSHPSMSEVLCWGLIYVQLLKWILLWNIWRVCCICIVIIFWYIDDQIRPHTSILSIQYVMHSYMNDNETSYQGFSSQEWLLVSYEGKSMCVGTCECACMRAHTLYNVAKVMYRNQVHSKGEANMPAYSGWWNKLTL